MTNAADFSGLLTAGRPARLMYFGYVESGEEHAPAAARPALADEAGDPEYFTADSAVDWIVEAVLDVLARRGGPTAGSRR